jgi:MoxR-like ATPase
MLTQNSVSSLNGHYELARCQPIYVRLTDNTWGVAGPIGIVADGAQIHVKRKNGDLKLTTIERILDKDSSVALATIIKTPFRGAPKGKREGAEHARQVCAFLEGRGWCKTSHVLNNLGIAKTLRGSVTRTMHQLAEIGVLHKSGAGRLHWKLADPNYDKGNPFNRAGGQTPIINDPPPATPTPAPYNPPVEAPAPLPVIPTPPPPAPVVIPPAPKPKSDKHKRFEDILALAEARQNILLVGPAGCGKSHMASQLAKHMKLRFASLSLTAGISETRLIGRYVQNITKGSGKFQWTPFLRRYSRGGVFLLDEMDRADGNMLAVLNTAIENGYVSIDNPGQSSIERNENFILVATANTYGRGETRQYSNANALDDSTLDRFRIGTIEVDYDRDIEAQLLPDAVLCRKLWAIRDRMIESGLDKTRTLSTRYFKQAASMAGVWSHDKIIGQFLMGWRADEKARVGY